MLSIDSSKKRQALIMKLSVQDSACLSFPNQHPRRKRRGIKLSARIKKTHNKTDAAARSRFLTKPYERVFFLFDRLEGSVCFWEQRGTLLECSGIAIEDRCQPYLRNYNEI